MDSLPEVSALFQGREFGSGGSLYVQLTTLGIKIGPDSDLPRVRPIPFKLLRDWSFDSQTFSLLIEDDASETMRSLEIVFADDQLSEFSYQFNAYRFAAYRTMHPAVEAAVCSHCGCYVDSLGGADPDVVYCPECHCMTDQAGRNLSVIDEHLYQFSGDGWFSLVGSKRDLGAKRFSFGVPSLREQVVPVLTRMAGLLIWLSVALGVLWMLPESWRSWPIVLSLMGMALLSLLLLGTHWSDLMMHGRLKPLLKKPAAEVMLRLLRSGRLAPADALLEKSELREHPGVLFNAARARFEASDVERGWQHLKVALARCGNHPVLLRLAVEYASAGDTAYWERRLERALAAGRLVRVDLVDRVDSVDDGTSVTRH